MFGIKIFKPGILNLLPRVRGKYLKNVSLAKYTWFGVGGPAEILYIPADIEDLSHFLKNKPYNLPICLIGGGSNLLVRDGGVPGVVIKLDSPLSKKHLRRKTPSPAAPACAQRVKETDAGTWFRRT